MRSLRLSFIPVCAWFAVYGVVSTLQCFDHHCHGDDYCKMTKVHHDQYTGVCTSHNHEHWCEDHNYFHDTDIHHCSCRSQECIDKVIGHGSLDCLGHHCSGQNHVCLLSKKDNHIKGACHEHHVNFCDDRNFLRDDHFTECRCLTEDCIHKVLAANKIHETTKLQLTTTLQTTLTTQTLASLDCLGNHCSGLHHVCLLLKRDNHIKGECHKGHVNFCEDRNYLKDDHYHECRCLTKDCINKVLAANIMHQTTISQTQTVETTKLQPQAMETTIKSLLTTHALAGTHELNCLGVICRGRLHACYLVKHENHLTGKCHERSVHLCEHRSYLKGSNHDCRCLNQDCINKVLDGLPPSFTILYSMHGTTLAQILETSNPLTGKTSTKTTMTTMSESSTPRSENTSLKTSITTLLETTTISVENKSAETPITTLLETTTLSAEKSSFKPLIATVKPQTTATSRVCHVCGDSQAKIPCRLDEIYTNGNEVPCERENEYCLTQVIHDDRGNTDVYKRCVDITTCIQKWLKESYFNDYCKNYTLQNEHIPFECNFCCLGDGCNTRIVPQKDLWFR